MPCLVATITGLALIAHAAAHVSLINIYGSNNVIGHAFGVNLYGKYPRVKGLPGDAGGDAGVFQTGTNNPSPACGHTPELGPIDIPAWLGQAEGDGLPAAYSNMSVVAEVFQVNRDGGGPMSCQYSEDATATSWKPMSMILNQAGNFGIQNQVRTNETVVMQFPPEARCSGGWTGTACIVRCLTGVNKRFGGCFAVKLSSSVVKQVSTTVNGSLPPIIREAAPASSSSEIPEAQINSIAKQVLAQMKQQGLVIAAGSSGKCPTSVQPIIASTATFDASDAEDDATNSTTPIPYVPGNNSTLNASGPTKQGVNPPSGSAASPISNHSLGASDLDDLDRNNGTAAAIPGASPNNTVVASKAKKPSRCRARSQHNKRHSQP